MSPKGVRVIEGSPQPLFRQGPRQAFGFKTACIFSMFLLLAIGGPALAAPLVPQQFSHGCEIAEGGGSLRELMLPADS